MSPMIPMRTLSVVVAALLVVVTAGGLCFSLAGATVPLRLPFLPDAEGTYYRGDGLGVNHTLQIEENGTFLFRWDGCLGNYARSAGSVGPLGSELVLMTIWRGRQKAWEVTEGRYLPIHWGDRRYLVPTEGIMSFLNEVNLGSEPRKSAHGLHYLRQDDWDVPVGDLPEVPARYRKYLLDEPIEGALFRQLEEPGTFEVVVDREGLAPGMALVSEGNVDHPLLCELKVLSVSGESAVVEAEESYDGSCELRPGHKVSTSLASLSKDPFRDPGSRWLR